jgi:hypothetical protein
MLNMWADTDSYPQGRHKDPVKEMKEMADVHKAMDMLKVMEVRQVSCLPISISSH